MAGERKGEERSLLSNSTVFILSVFLIGVALGGLGGSEFSSYVLDCGLAGLVAYLGLEVAQNRRRTESIQQEQKVVENRLDRHVKPALQSAAGSLPTPASGLPRIVEFSQSSARAD